VTGTLEGVPIANGVAELSKTALTAAGSSEADAVFAALARLSPDDLASTLPGDAEKRAFWLNVYNAVVRHELRRRPELYRRRFRFFARRRITIAGQELSLNAIEHGLLRRSAFGYSLGYVSNPLPGRFERRFRVGSRDHRVHFALNCGARSCPPVRAYTAATVDALLDDAARDYLATGVAYDPAKGTVTVPRLLLWFRADFGGSAGIRRLLEEHRAIPPGSTPRIRYANYDWTLSPG
jgi:hypothetical protein